MVPVPVRDWGDAIFTSITQALALFLAAIPKIIGFIIILAIGWLVASLVAKGAAALLRSIRFEDMSQRSGFAGFVRNTGVHTDSSGFVADIAKWFIRLITLVVAFDALGLPAVSDVLRQLLLWLPNLAVAIVVLIIGGLAANALAGLVRGATAEADLGNPNLLANIARVAVWAFAIVVAVNQIGIARELVNTLFMATVGAVALALGLAFGIGGRDTAAEMVREWYARSRRAAPKLEEAAEQMRRDVESGKPRPH
jgi:small-conductance mechanosensitive channel